MNCSFFTNFIKGITKRNNDICKEYQLSEIFLIQTNDRGYNRWDTVVRLLAVEEEAGLNSHGWFLYRKMQKERNGESPERVELRVENFKKMIHGKVNYQNIPIVLDRELKLYDGSHRMALGIFYETSRIRCIVNYDIGITDTDYGEGWFFDHGFLEEEVSIIRCRLNDLIIKFSQ